MGGPSGGSSSGTQKTVAEPWKEQRPFLLDIFRQAENQFHQPGPGYYPGQTVAGQSPATTQAQQYILGQATNQGQQVGQMGVDSLGRLLNGGRSEERRVGKEIRSRRVWLRSLEHMEVPPYVE